jgi:FkbM family methyltransferase
VLQFARWTGPSGRVIAFEPNPGARRVLEKHIHLNALAEATRVVPSAVGATNGHAMLYAAGSDGMSRLGAPNARIATAARPVRVEVVTLDTYCEEHDVQPDWLLIDIEGFEIAALEGARRLIRDRKPRLGLVVEMHPNVWHSADTTRAGAEALLEELGLQIVPLTGQKFPLDEHGLVHLAYRT